MLHLAFKKPYGYLLLLSITVFASCADDTSSPQCYHNICDSCLQDLPLTPSDSIWHNYPMPSYIHYDVLPVAQNKLMGYVIVNGWKGSSWTDGIFVYDTEMRELLDYFIGYDPSLSNRRDKIAYDNGSEIRIRNIATRSEQVIAKGFSKPRWSLDDKYLYMNQNIGFRLYKVNIDDTSKQIVGDSLYNIRQRNANVLIAIGNNVIYSYDEGKKTRRIIELRLSKDEVVSGYNQPYDVSPDGSTMLLEVASRRGFLDRDNGGLFVVDMSTGESKKILRSQYWGDAYCPLWISNDRFYASFFCRKDSASTIYEYSITGDVMKQVTNIYDVLYR
jgi:hypothetical protein